MGSPFFLSDFFLHEKGLQDFMYFRCMNKKLKLDELGRMKNDEFKSAKKIPLVLVLDNIRSGLNVGSVFRSSDAFRVQEVMLCGICAQPPHRDILKSALGATEVVDWTYHESSSAAITQLKERGFKLAAIEQAENSCSLENWEPKGDEKWAVIFGNEVKGVQQELIDASDLCIEIPQFGTKHSLNISVCAGMILWQYMLKCGLNEIK